MQFDRAAEQLVRIPYTTPNKGAFFYKLVLDNNIKDVLELGFAHGCSTCYFAAALQERNGHADAVDVEASLQFEPTIEELSRRLSLEDVITIHREKSSYTWFLRKKIEEQTEDNVCKPCYDLVFIDGPKDWTNDGAAFFMADKLLRPGGLIMFDDYDWTYRDHEQRSGKRHEEGYVFRRMSQQEFCEPQIERVFSLLVMQHPNYGEFEIVDSELAIARKIGEHSSKSLTLTTRKSVNYRVAAALKRIWSRRTMVQNAIYEGTSYGMDSTRQRHND